MTQLLGSARSLCLTLRNGRVCVVNFGPTEPRSTVRKSRTSSLESNRTTSRLRGCQFRWRSHRLRRAVDPRGCSGIRKQANGVCRRTVCDSRDAVARRGMCATKGVSSLGAGASVALRSQAIGQEDTSSTDVFRRAASARSHCQVLLAWQNG
jgi:hypothetical protein